MTMVDSVDSIDIWFRHRTEFRFDGHNRARVRFWFIWVKELGKLLDGISHRNAIVSLMLIFWGSLHLEQCWSAGPLWKFHHCSQSQESDRLFLRNFGNSWTSQNEGPPHCLHRGQGQNHESGLWFRDWRLHNLKEFLLGALGLSFCNYFLGFISYLLMRCLSSIIHGESKNIWLSLGQRTLGFVLTSDCYLSLDLFHDPRKAGSIFHGRRDVHH